MRNTDSRVQAVVARRVPEVGFAALQMRRVASGLVAWIMIG